MDEQQISRAAQLLIEARRVARPRDGLPPECRPSVAAESYSVQERVTALLGEPIGGWKAGISPGAEPTAAPLFASLMAASPARVPVAKVPVLGVEAEIAFRFARDLAPRKGAYDAAEVAAAIGSAHAAIEIVDSRYSKFQSRSKPEQLADNMSNGFFVYGPALGDWRGVDLSRLRVRLTVGGATIADKIGGNAAANLLDPVVWLAGHLASRGATITAGQIVTTGSCTGMNFAKPGDEVVAAFEGLGEARVTFTP